MCNYAQIVSCHLHNICFSCITYHSVESAAVRRVLPIGDMAIRSSKLKFGLNLHRCPLYYVFNLILPTVLLALLSAFVFTIPADSGEKMSNAITFLLGCFNFLLLLSGHIPPMHGTGPMLGKVTRALNSIIISEEARLLCYPSQESQISYRFITIDSELRKWINIWFFILQLRTLQSKYAFVLFL